MGHPASLRIPLLHQFPTSGCDNGERPVCPRGFPPGFPPPKRSLDGAPSRVGAMVRPGHRRRGRADDEGRAKRQDVRVLLRPLYRKCAIE